MRNRIVIYAPGSTIKVADHIEGKILQACIIPGGTVQYQISWFESGDRKVEWLFDFELEGAEKKKESVIITSTTSVKSTNE